jgi:hypothetical protein
MNLIFTSIVASAMFASPVLAQTAQPDPGHPRVNEVDDRLANQQNRINNGVANGQMTQGQANRDEKRDARVERQATRDEARHGGHLTKREQRHMNRELNHNSRNIHRQRHPVHHG